MGDRNSKHSMIRDEKHRVSSDLEPPRLHPRMDGTLSILSLPRYIRDSFWSPRTFVLLLCITTRGFMMLLLLSFFLSFLTAFLSDLWNSFLLYFLFLFHGCHWNFMTYVYDYDLGVGRENPFGEVICKSIRNRTLFSTAYVNQTGSVSLCTAKMSRITWSLLQIRTIASSRKQNYPGLQWPCTFRRSFAMHEFVTNSFCPKCCVVECWAPPLEKKQSENRPAIQQTRLWIRENTEAQTSKYNVYLYIIQRLLQKTTEVDQVKTTSGLHQQKS